LFDIVVRQKLTQNIVSPAPSSFSHFSFPSLLSKYSPHKHASSTLYIDLFFSTTFLSYAYWPSSGGIGTDRKVPQKRPTFTGDLLKYVRYYSQKKNKK